LGTAVTHACGWTDAPYFFLGRAPEEEAAAKGALKDDGGKDGSGGAHRCMASVFTLEEFFEGGFVAGGAEHIEFVPLRPGGGHEAVDLRELRRGRDGGIVAHGGAVHDKEPEVALFAGREGFGGAEANHGDFGGLPVFDGAAGHRDVLQAGGQRVIGGGLVPGEVGLDLRSVVGEQIHVITAGGVIDHLGLVIGEGIGRRGRHLDRFMRPIKDGDDHEGGGDSDGGDGADDFVAPGNGFAAGGLFGNDLFPEAGEDGDLPELFAQGDLARAMFLEPAGEFGIGLGEGEGLGDLRVFGVGGAGPVEQEDLFDFVAVHDGGGVSMWVSK
jgi:hypothetical protein